MIILIALTIIEIFFLLVTRGKKAWLRTLVIANMILIALLGAKLVEIGDFVSNVGNIFFATVITGQALLLGIYGRKIALESVRLIYYALIAVLTLSFGTALVPVVAGNERLGNAIVNIGLHNPQIIIASFVAFVLSQAVLILLLEKLKFSKFSNYSIAIVFTQIVDSIVFFPIAFWGGNYVAILFTGLFIKIAVGIILYPAYRFLLVEYKNKYHEVSI